VVAAGHVHQATPSTIAVFRQALGDFRLRVPDPNFREILTTSSVLPHQRQT
jgi:hypothetical protein